MKLPPRMTCSHGAFYHRSYRSTPEGRRQVWVRLGTEYSVAIKRYAAVEADRDRNKRDMAGLIAAYLASHEFAKKAKGTQTNYKIFARELTEAFAGVLPADVRPSDAQAILDRATKAVKAQNLVWFLRTLLSWGAARSWLPSNPLIGFRTGPRARRTRYLTDEELAAIEAQASPQLRAFIRLAYVTALRRGDLMALKWSAVQGGVLKAFIQKTKVPHTLTVNADLRAVLDELKSLRGAVPGVYLLPGKKPSGDTYAHLFKAAAKAAGVSDATIHDIRRKRLTDVTNTEGLESARRLAGHTTQGMTQRYYAGDHAIETPPLRGRREANGAILAEKA